jgi:hypothetical protein
MLHQLVFVMPLNGALRTYQDFENLFDFYPGGIKSLILEYVLMYSIPVGSSYWDAAQSCSAGLGTMEEEMLEKVIGLYESSWNYRAKQHAYPNCQHEFTIETVCTDMARMLYTAVRDQRHFFQMFEPGFDPKEVLFLGDAAAIKIAVRLPLAR